MTRAKVFDPETHRSVEVLESSLPAGMVYLQVEGLGKVWVQPDKLEPDGTEEAYPPLSSELRKKVEEGIMRPLWEVYPQSLEKWEEGFRRDTDAEAEIALWLTLVERYTAFIQQNPLTRQAREEVFDLMLRSTLAQDEFSFWSTVRLQHLTREDAKTAIAPFRSKWNERTVEADTRV